MPKQFRLKIADPCHEDWDKMTASDKGKFCGSCQKQVIDFTRMTDTQLAAYFKKPSKGSLCGRFLGDQLDRKITVPRKEIPWIKYFFQFTIPLFLASCTGNRTKGKVAVETGQKKSTSDKTVCTATTGLISLPDNEEVQLAPIETVGEIWVDGITYIEPPDTTRCSSKIEIADKEEIKFNSLFTDSLLPKARFTINKPDNISVEPKLLISNEINGPRVNQELIGFLGGLTVEYNSISDVVFNSEESEETEPPVIQDLEPGFKMYANPARANSNVFIDAKKSEEGLYAIQLLNLSGQLIKQDQVRMGKGMGITQFSIPAIPSGNYLVVLLNKKTGKSSTEKLIVQ